MDYVIKDTDLTAIANAIRSKNGSSDTYTVAEMADEIGKIGLQPEEKDVDFIDYDGTLIYSYTAEEFLAMTKMPPNPQHEGLLAQGWNWSIEDAKAVVEDCGFHVIGQNYTTDDGSTKIYITISEMDPLGPMRLIGYAVEACTYIIDWGDNNTETFTSAANSTIRINHNYNTKGDFVISWLVTNGTFILGYYGSNSGIVWDNSPITNDAIKRVTKIEIGNGCIGLGTQPFVRLTNLKSVSIPITCSQEIVTGGTNYTSVALKGLVIPPGIMNLKGFDGMIQRISFPNTIISMAANHYLRYVTKIVIPDSVTTVASYTLRSLNLIKKLKLSNSVTTYPDNFCNYLGYGLESITVPAAVTSIGSSFMSESRLSKIYLRPTTPPTLSNVNAFPNTYNNAIFYVPYSNDHSILEAYQTATNWSTYASKMVEEEPQS